MYPASSIPGFPFYLDRLSSRWQFRLPIFRLRNGYAPQSLDLIRQARCGAELWPEVARDGLLPLSRLIVKRGREAKIAWLDEIRPTAQKIAHSMNDRAVRNVPIAEGVVAACLEA